jgi:hypothetical protein
VAEEIMSSAVDALGELLDALGKARKAVILGWVRQEMRTRAIVQYAYERGAPLTLARDEHGQLEKDAHGRDVTIGGPNVWQLGQASPLNPAETIFAMFLDPDARSVSVYTFTLTPSEDGAQAVHFFRADLFDLIHVHGPVHHDALVSELGSFLADDAEVERAERDLERSGSDQPNGAPS